METKGRFTLDEVKKLVKNAYEVGYCDGTSDKFPEWREYKGADDFWMKNAVKWRNEEITLAG